ncbi:MAG: FKBP-type peptidyl-prolyl cis-trans isomerase [Bacteroidota bacterium]
MSFTFHACKRSASDTGKASPLKVKVIERGKGRKTTPGDLMQLSLRYGTENGDTVYSSVSLGEDFILAVSKPMYGGDPNEAFLVLHEGDSAEFTTSADSVFLHTFNQALPSVFSPGDKIRFHLRLERLFTEQEFAEENNRRITTQRSLEDEQIRRYLDENLITAGAARPGVYFIELVKGKGPGVKAGDSVAVAYTGRFLDGTIFDGSYSGKGTGLLWLRAGDGSRIKAWEDAVLSMRKGGVCRLILTSDNAYGRAGAGPVPGKTPIIYDIELKAVVSLLP